MDQTPSLSNTDRTLAGIGGVAGAIPFFVTFSTSSSVTIDGVVQSATYRDNVAIACGAVAVVLGAAAAAIAKKNGGDSTRVITGVAVLGFGIFVILAKGLGMISI